jgi:hypothetical protein
VVTPAAGAIFEGWHPENRGFLMILTSKDDPLC